jgi:hypothetical protein
MIKSTDYGMADGGNFREQQSNNQLFSMNNTTAAGVAKIAINWQWWHDRVGEG